MVGEHNSNTCEVRSDKMATEAGNSGIHRGMRFSLWLLAISSHSHLDLSTSSDNPIDVTHEILTEYCYTHANALILLV